jgi:hypothetical protein
MMMRKSLHLFFASLLLSVCATLPAQAKPKLQSATLIKFYKKHCLAELRELQGRLRAGKILIAGTTQEAYRSADLACPFDPSNPTMKQLANPQWIAQTDTYINKVGLKAYLLSSGQTMAVSMKQSHVLETLAHAPKTGLTNEDMLVLGITVRSVAFTKAHMEAAALTYKK